MFIGRVKARLFQMRNAGTNLVTMDKSKRVWTSLVVGREASRGLENLAMASQAGKTTGNLGITPGGNPVGANNILDQAGNDKSEDGPAMVGSRAHPRDLLRRRV